MRMTFWSKCAAAAVVSLLPVAACSSTTTGVGGSTSSATSTGTTSTTSTTGATTGTTSTTTSTTSTSSSSGGDVAQTPPTDTADGGAAIEAWLAAGHYKSWHCEAAIHAAAAPSVHTPFDKVCSNDVLNATAAPPWPVGAASVKEVYSAIDGTTPVGYAVSLKTADDTTAKGTVWYWYERVPGFTSAGVGDTTCTGCHEASAAPVDAGGHPGAGDLIYIKQ